MRGTASVMLATTSILVAAAVAVGAATVGTQAQRVERPTRSFSVVAVGDWLSEHRFNEAAAAAAPAGVRLDHVPLLSPVASLVSSASLAICHMEVPISGPGEPYGYVGRSAYGTSLIAAPYEAAADLRRVGFDRCSTASNHSWDLGNAGIGSTLDALDAAGLSHTGTARSPAEARPQVFEIEGVRVAHLSFARNSNTGYPSEPWRFRPVRGADEVVATVAEARSAGAEVVIVSLHVFVEMQRTPTADDRALVEQILRRSPVDLVLIHGPHTIQPLEIVDGTPVFWSLGNFVSAMGLPYRGRYADLRTLDGLLAAVRFTETAPGVFAAEAAPVLLCQMVHSRVVLRGFDPLGLPGDDRDRAGVAACRDRSVRVVAGLR